MNRLAQEKSPYLLQHADNPVDWRPWGAEALEEATRLGKPILLSIGYAACHWCHVMAHESFEDETVAALMNERFVNIKVDREERPDIDQLYMSALQALGEPGGWPLTMFLTPAAEPFWGGTYFPPEPRWGRPSFRQVLTAVADAFARGDAAIANNSATLARALAAGARSVPGEGVTPALIGRVADAYLRRVDPQHGGLRGAPKFPNPPIYRLLWQAGGEAGRAATHSLLRHMSQGGIYDHLGGGYARYSTDAEWLVPHFEKMLYDNAQLLELLALAFADRPDPLYAERAAETVGWLVRDMQTEGAFAASEDADSEGEEGRFYVWSLSEVTALLGADAAPFARAYDVTEAGNWEGHSILRRIAPPGDPADEALLGRARASLFEARAQRPRPTRDDKILADWNGLAIAALARAAAVFRRPDWLALARATFARIVGLLARPDGRLDHAWRDGRITAPGLLEDQAAMARAALALFQSTGGTAYLAEAERIAEAACRHFADEDGSFFTTADDAPDVPITRPRTAADQAIPNGNGLMADLFAGLHQATGAPHYRTRAEAILRAFSGAAEGLAAMPTLLAAADRLGRGPTIVVASDPGHPQGAALLETALALPDPAMLVLRAPAGSALPVTHPAHGKQAAPDGSPLAYLCRGSTCSAPVGDPAALRALA